MGTPTIEKISFFFKQYRHQISLEGKKMRALQNLDIHSLISLVAFLLCGLFVITGGEQ